MTVQTRGFHLFLYGTLLNGNGASALMTGCTRLCDAIVSGTLYDIDGAFPALMPYGQTPVAGEILYCSDVGVLQRLDAYEGVAQGLFRRIGMEIQGHACWVYVAGPALARKLTPDRRVTGGRWLRVDR